MNLKADTSTRIAGLVCVLTAVGLFLGATCWLGVLLFFANSGRVESAALRMPVAAGAFQLAVSILFALSGTLLLRRSRRAKPLLITAVISLVVDLALGVAAFVAFGQLLSSGT